MGVAAAAAAAAWDTALKAHFAQRGGGKGKGVGRVVGARPPPPASRRVGGMSAGGEKEDGGDGSARHAGLLVAPDAPLGGGRGGLGR